MKKPFSALIFNQAERRGAGIGEGYPTGLRSVGAAPAFSCAAVMALPESTTVQEPLTWCSRK